jgi:hypothetical protein
MERYNMKFDEFISSLSDENLNNIQYLHATLIETLRVKAVSGTCEKNENLVFLADAKDKKLYCL